VAGCPTLRVRDSVTQMAKRPFVSVVIPAHNAVATIARALESVLVQRYEPIEIIVVDDGSTDATRDVVQRYETAGVRLLTIYSQGGASKARNAGIEVSKGEFIAFLDADDEWLETKLKKQVSVMTSDDRLSLVYCVSNHISTTGQDLGDIYQGRKTAAGPDAWKILLAANFIATPAVVARRRDIEPLGGFDPELKIGEDQDMWIRLGLAGPIGFVPESLVRVHARPNSLSNLAFRDQLQYTLPMIERHIATLKDRLSASEIRTIRGERLGRLGRIAYNNELHAEGIRMIVRSIALGYRPWGSLAHLMTSSPPAKWLKRLIRRIEQSFQAKRNGNRSP
jgi:glycosyltransferase involved in cell wall biosynthesis